MFEVACLGGSAFIWSSPWADASAGCFHSGHLHIIDIGSTSKRTRAT